MSSPPHVVVLGAGVMGCATAYYLSRRGVRVTVVEREAIGSCASGFALGLLNPLTGIGIPGPMAPFAEAGFSKAGTENGLATALRRGLTAPRSRSKLGRSVPIPSADPVAEKS